MSLHELLEELRKWTQHSDLTAMLELRAELSKVRMIRKDYVKVPSSALLAIENKNKNARVSVDETEWGEELIVAVIRDYLIQLCLKRLIGASYCQRYKGYV